MKRIIILSVFLLLLSLTQGQDKVNFPPQPKPPSSTAKPTEAPTHPPKTTTAPTTTTTPSVPTTTPTVPTTTPTVPPTTTSDPPTTTSVPTTPAPTTPAPRPSTTVAPTPKPDAVGTWSLNYTNTNLTCIVLEMQLHLKVPYTSTQEKTLNASIPVSNIATATGKCVDEDMQNITLVWNEKNSIKFMFERNETSKQFMLATISVAIVPDSASFPNMTDNATINAELNKHEFVTPLKMSYRCSKEETLNVPFISNENKSMTFVISKLQMEAFRNTTGMVFSTAEDCAPFETPGIVPIAVGCSLAALIILVLIAYLVGRRRSQARGYLSM